MNIEAIIITFCAGMLAMECLMQSVRIFTRIYHQRRSEKKLIARMAALNTWVYPEDSK